MLYPPLGGSKKNFVASQVALTSSISMYWKFHTIWQSFWRSSFLVLISQNLHNSGSDQINDKCQFALCNINKILKMRSAHFKKVFSFFKNVSKAILQHASELISKTWTLVPGFAYRRLTHRAPCWRQDCEDTETHTWPLYKIYLTTGMKGWHRRSLNTKGCASFRQSLPPFFYITGDNINKYNIC